MIKKKEHPIFEDFRKREQKLKEDMDRLDKMEKSKSLETKERICETLSEKKSYKRMIEKLNQIEQIASFQQKRLKWKKSNEKEAILKQAIKLMFIYLGEIAEEL